MVDYYRNSIEGVPKCSACSGQAVDFPGLRIEGLRVRFKCIVNES